MTQVVEFKTLISERKREEGGGRERENRSM
jgi:hypothetical protein